MSLAVPGERKCERAGVTSGARLVCGVYPPSELAKMGRLLDALSEVTAVTFQPREADQLEGLSGLIVIGGFSSALQKAMAEGIPSFVLTSKPANGLPQPMKGSTLRFSNDRSLPIWLKGETWSELVYLDEGLPNLPETTEPLAWVEDRPVWARHQYGSVAGYRVALPLPTLAKGETLATHLNSETFNAVLPLVHFLKEMTSEQERPAQPTRACFVFDDPNLHGTSYGCLNLLKLAADARRHGYHAAIAMVPLDSWWVNQRAAALFREQSQFLSLAIHGNNHTWLELATRRSADEYLALLAQALRRIQKVEQQHRVKFCRVMEPPFGVVHYNAFDALIALGYEAVLFTPRQLLAYNPDCGWPLTFGLNRNEFLAGGLCAIPRIVMSPRWKLEAGLAAWLEQPVVFAGHHWNAAQGLGFMSEICSTLQSWGPVRWCRLSEIARSNFRALDVGSAQVVQIASRCIQISAVQSETTIQFERQWLSDDERERLLVQHPDTGQVFYDQLCGRWSEPLSFARGSPLLVSSFPNHQRDPAQAPGPGSRIWPIVRRTLTEARDRAYQLTHF